MLGFCDTDAASQRSIEARLSASVAPDRIRRHLRALTREPHLAGSPANLRIAEYIADHFDREGLETSLAEYDVLLSELRESTVELVEPHRHLARTREDGFDADPDSRHPAVSPFWVAYSASGEVVAPLVYANYGRPEDYERLAALAIDVRGCIVLARSFHGYRGSKAYEAERRGVAGLVFYSDPFEDGAPRGPVYSEGPWAPMDRAERGSGTYDFLYPGDPLTPGRPSPRASSGWRSPRHTPCRGS